MKYARLLLVAFLAFCQMSFAKEAEKWAPDYIIIGAQKSGTTPLYHFLKQHPQIVFKKGEVHFFDLMFAHGSRWYKNRFDKRPTPQHLIGDKSPYYMCHPKVPERVHSLYPNVKIIAILRNPIDRAYSHYWHNQRAKREPLSFKEAIAAEPERLAGEKEKLMKDPKYKSNNYRRYSYLERGHYAEQLKRWLEFFPKEQIMVISSSDLRNKTEEVMQNLFTFLNLPSFTPKAYKSGAHKYPAMNPEVRKELAAYFQPYNEELEALLGRKFNWK